MVESEGTINIHKTVSDFVDETKPKKVESKKLSPMLSVGNYSIEIDKKELII